MTTISTMAELTALDEGTAILLNGQTWLRQGDAFRRGSYTLSFEAFEGPVAEGRITATIRLQPGQWYTGSDGRVFYIHDIGASEDGQRMVSMTFNPTDGVGLCVVRTSIDGWEATERTTPVWATPLLMNALNQTANAERRDEREIAILEDRHSQERRRRVRLADNTEAFLHGLVENDEDLRDDIVEFCESNELEPPRPSTQQVEFTVEVEGEVEVEFDSDDISRQVSGSVRIPWGTTVSQEVEFEWSYENTVEVPYGSCACDTVSRDDVESMLDSEGIDYSSFTYEVSCEND